MPTLEEIQSEIENLPNGDREKKNRAVKELPNILYDDEHVGNITHGGHFYYGYIGVKNGILVATDSRVLFIDKGLIYGVNADAFLYKEITSIKIKHWPLFDEIVLYTRAGEFEIRGILKEDAKNFCEYVCARINIPADGAAQSNKSIDDSISKNQDVSRSVLEEDSATEALRHSLYEKKYVKCILSIPLGIKIIIALVLWAAAAVLAALMMRWNMLYMFDSHIVIVAGNPLWIIPILLHINKLALVIGILDAIPIFLFFPIKKIFLMPDGWKKLLFIVGAIWLTIACMFAMLIGIIYFAFYIGAMPLLK